MLPPGLTRAALLPPWFVLPPWLTGLAGGVLLALVPPWPAGLSTLSTPAAPATRALAPTAPAAAPALRAATLKNAFVFIDIRQGLRRAGQALGGSDGAGGQNNSLRLGQAFRQGCRHDGLRWEMGSAVSFGWLKLSEAEHQAVRLRGTNVDDAGQASRCHGRQEGGVARHLVIDVSAVFVILEKEHERATGGG